MTQAQITPRTATVLHLALCASLVLGVLVLAFVPNPGGVAPDVRPLLTYVPLTLAAVAFGASQLVLTRLPAEPADAAAWWQAHLPRAVAGWALLEGGSLLSAVAYFLTREAFILIMPAVGFVLLTLSGPRRLGPG